MSIDAYKDLPVKHLAQILKILGEPNRLRILCSMGLECRPVSDIVSATGMTQTNVSFHLRALREAGLVKDQKNGAFVYYCLYDVALLEILNHLHQWLASLDGRKVGESFCAQATRGVS